MHHTLAFGHTNSWLVVDKLDFPSIEEDTGNTSMTYLGRREKIEAIFASIRLGNKYHCLLYSLNKLVGLIKSACLWHPIGAFE